MTKQVWKFVIDDITNIVIPMPKNAEVLTIQMQGQTPCIWALVEPTNELEKRYFELHGTGHTILYGVGVVRKYINTIQVFDGSLIFHLFERIS